MRETALQEIDSAADLQALQALRVRYLGKKGELTAQLKTLGGLPPEERRSAGAARGARPRGAPARPRA